MNADPHVWHVGHIEDIDGLPLAVGVDYDTVSIGPARLTSALCEEFARLFMSACWQAAAQSGTMAADEVTDGV